MAVAESNGTYACPGCGGTLGSPAQPYNGFAMVQCHQCSLLHTVERDFAVSQYENVYAQQSAYRDMIEAAQRTAAGEAGYRELWWFKRMGIRWLEQYGRGRLLDVGCGPGTFLLVARQRDWEVVGQEPAVEAAQLARTFGLEIFNGMVEDLARQSPIRFHAITSFEVIEHVSRPREMLRAMRDLLEPGGHMLISVPNLDILTASNSRSRLQHLLYTLISSIAAVLARLCEQPGSRFFASLLCPSRAAAFEISTVGAALLLESHSCWQCAF